MPRKTQLNIAWIFIAIISFKNTHAQKVTSEQLYKRFQDSLSVKAPESTLIKLKMNYLLLNQRKTASDSLDESIISVYPKGQTALSKINTQNLSKNKSSKSESGLEALMKQTHPSIIKKDTIGATEDIKKLNANILHLNALTWLKNNQYLGTAEMFAKSALDKTKLAISELPEGDSSNKTANLKRNYALYEDTYASILSKEGKDKDALVYEEDAYNFFKGTKPDVNNNYMRLLNTTGQYQKALTIGNNIFKIGKGNDFVKAQLTEAYKRVFPNKSVSAYIDSLDAIKNKISNDHILASMINKPSHDFILKDLDGNEVSLASLKGKIVVLDFWATWCIPCKMSFPGMQLAINKYKENKDVVFLFVDTWERSSPEQRFKDVSGFIKDKEYTFQVLLDRQNATNSAEYEVVKEYGIKGIPTKFIIGKDGNIKFEMVGYSGSDESVLNEVSGAIDILLKG